ncbi:MAG: ABC transporter permease [Proteobacteria bacterium]|nr:ABC transporter permease [Pseudomonadota bacterium]
MRRILNVTGRSLRRALAHVGNATGLLRAIVRAGLRLPRSNFRVFLRVVSLQIRFTGLQAVPLIAALAAAIGAVGIMEFVALLTGLADDLIGKLLVTIVIREMGPLITAVVIIARSGTAMATELGSMRLGGELEALQAYRVDPIAFVLLPRVAGAIVSTFILIVVFDAVGLLGGAAIASALRGLSFSLVSAKVQLALTNRDIWLTALKSVLFGGLIALLSCYLGLLVRGSSTELPKAVAKAVVASLAAVFVLDAALAAAFLL